MADMKHFATFASLALLVAATCSAPTFAADATTDKTGMSDLGVDISKAGASKQENQAYLQTLTPEEQTKVKEVCLMVVPQPTAHTPEVVAFCKNVNPA
jgi:hypothetical protein